MPKTGKNLAWSANVRNDEHHVDEHSGSHQKEAVDAVQDTAMARQNVPGVLHAHGALDERLDQIAKVAKTATTTLNPIHIVKSGTWKNSSNQ